MTTIDTARYGRDVPELVGESGDISLAVAYVTTEGLRSIRPHLLERLGEGRTVRVLLDLQSGSTDPSAVWDLRAIADEFGALQLKTFVPDKDQGIIHSKLYIAHSERSVTFLTGSANLTGAALSRNREHGLRVHGASNEADVRQALAAFEEFWNAPESKVIDDEAARLYEAYCGRLRMTQTRAERRARAAWTRLAEHLSTVAPEEFSWPSAKAAFLMGAIAARGRLHVEKQRIEIGLRFRPTHYKDGMITMREQSYDAATVLPTIPQTIATHARDTIPEAPVTVERMKVAIDLTDHPNVLDAIAAAYAPNTECNDFILPKDLRQCGDDIVTEFVRGFAVACALATDHTSMPGNKRTGTPGQMMVWLRPKQSNERLFHALYDLITDRLGIVVYRHMRRSRDPHLKIRCEDFQQIGFGVDWWDALVEAGAAHNFALFPQAGFPSEREPPE